MNNRLIDTDIRVLITLLSNSADNDSEPILYNYCDTNSMVIRFRYSVANDGSDSEVYLEVKEKLVKEST